MQIHNCCIHKIDKIIDIKQTTTYLNAQEISQKQELQLLFTDLTSIYNSRNKVWGNFTHDSAVKLWVKQFINKEITFVEFTTNCMERLTKLINGNGITIDGHIVFGFYQQNMANYLVIAILHHAHGLYIDKQLGINISKFIDFSSLHLAARINLTAWQAGINKNNYISIIKSKSLNKISNYFINFIGFETPENNRTSVLLQAFEHYIKDEPIEVIDNQQKTLKQYANKVVKTGELASINEISQALNSTKPEDFKEFAVNNFQLEEHIPINKTEISNWHKFSVKTTEITINFDAKLLGNTIEYDKDSATLTLKDIPESLKTQLNNYFDTK